METRNKPSDGVSINNYTPNTKSKKVYACPSCGKKLRKKYNKNSLGWHCYVCDNRFDTPVARSEDYYKQYITLNGKKVLRKNKRKFEPSKLIEREHFLKLLNQKYNNIYTMSKKDIRNSAFISFLFLTGARIQEVVGVRARDVAGGLIKGKYVVEPVRKFQLNKFIYPTDDLMILEVKDMPVLKRRLGQTIDEQSGIVVNVVPTRNVSIFVDYEKEFIDFVERWVNTLKDDDVLFDFSPGHGWRICYQFNKMYNHYWRHMRASDLVKTYNFNSLQLKHFFGWASEEQAQNYAHLSDKDLKDSMIMGWKNKKKLVKKKEFDDEEE